MVSVSNIPTEYIVLCHSEDKPCHIITADFLCFLLYTGWLWWCTLYNSQYNWASASPYIIAVYVNHYIDLLTNKVCWLHVWVMWLSCDYYSYRSLWSIRNYIHIMLCVSLSMAQFVFIVGIDKINDKVSSRLVHNSLMTSTYYSFISLPCMQKIGYIVSAIFLYLF